MFKEYIYLGHQTAPENQQIKVFVNLMTVYSFWRNPANGAVRIMGPGLGFDLYMTETQYDEFKLNMKTAARLKHSYE